MQQGCLLGQRVLEVGGARCHSYAGKQRNIHVSRHQLLARTAAQQPVSSQDVAKLRTFLGVPKSRLDKLGLSEKNFRSRPKHRFIVGGSLVALTALTFRQNILLGAPITASTFGTLLATILLSYIFADLGSAVYHWAIDNYGDDKTPLFGSQIRGFRNHHVTPWIIAHRDFCNNTSRVFGPFMPIAAVYALLAPANLFWDSFVAGMVTWLSVSWQFHAWSHIKTSLLPRWVTRLQDMGLILPPSVHGKHHRAPFNCNYAVMTGLWNPVLDFPSPDKCIFARLEKLIHFVTGIEPRGWNDPKYFYEAKPYLDIDA